jgi:hypothetical protein
LYGNPHRKDKTMDIGKIEKVERIELPERQPAETPKREPIPRHEPAPDTPQREPQKVPATPSREAVPA